MPKYQKYFIATLVFTMIFSGGVIAGGLVLRNIQPVTADSLRLDEQTATIRAINLATPAVVTIIISDTVNAAAIDLGNSQVSNLSTKVVKGTGSGFLISADGLILTNKHVVDAGNPATAEYKVILANGKSYLAKVIGRDPANDLGVLKIDGKNFPFAKLGDSSQLTVGTSVIAIGNALGRYDNSATKGIISGLGRNVVASDSNGTPENLDNVLQTDAEINPGNSGGPLIDLNGAVVGINVAIDLSANTISFAIPINDAKPVVNSAKTLGRIVRPFLGVRYIMLTPELAAEKSYVRGSGAMIITDDPSQPAVLPDSPAGLAGLAEGDVIIAINNINVDSKHPLLSLIQQFMPGAKVKIKIQRDSQILEKTVTLTEFK